MRADVIRLQPTRLPMLPLQMELLPYRVHCSHPGCRWSCPVRDEADAYVVLEQHLNGVFHAGGES